MKSTREEKKEAKNEASEQDSVFKADALKFVSIWNRGRAENLNKATVVDSKTTLQSAEYLIDRVKKMWDEDLAAGILSAEQHRVLTGPKLLLAASAFDSEMPALENNDEPSYRGQSPRNS